MKNYVYRYFSDIEELVNVGDYFQSIVGFRVYYLRGIDKVGNSFL